jgi:hypothetical protein
LLAIVDLHGSTGAEIGGLLNFLQNYFASDPLSEKILRGAQDKSRGWRKSCAERRINPGDAENPALKETMQKILHSKKILTCTENPRAALLGDGRKSGA